MTCTDPGAHFDTPDLLDRICASYVAALFSLAPMMGIVVLLTTLREAAALGTVLVGTGVGVEIGSGKAFPQPERPAPDGRRSGQSDFRAVRMTVREGRPEPANRLSIDVVDAIAEPLPRVNPFRAHAQPRVIRSPASLQKLPPVACGPTADFVRLGLASSQAEQNAGVGVIETKSSNAPCHGR